MLARVTRRLTSQTRLLTRSVAPSVVVHDYCNHSSSTEKGMPLSPLIAATLVASGAQVAWAAEAATNPSGIVAPPLGGPFADAAGNAAALVRGTDGSLDAPAAARVDAAPVGDGAAFDQTCGVALDAGQAPGAAAGSLGKSAGLATSSVTTRSHTRKSRAAVVSPSDGNGAAFDEVSGATLDADVADVAAASVDAAAAAESTESFAPGSGRWFVADERGDLSVKPEILAIAREAAATAREAAARGDAPEPSYAETKMLEVLNRDSQDEGDNPGGPDFEAKSVETQAPPPSRREIKFEALSRSIEDIFTRAGPFGVHLEQNGTGKGNYSSIKHLYTQFTKVIVKNGEHVDMAPLVNRARAKGTVVHLLEKLAPVFDR